jgi:hypothetical protein
MYKSISYWFSFIYAMLLLMTLVFDNYAAISIVLFLLIVLSILYKVGQGIVMLESISLFYVFTCLVMPVVGYKYYNYGNALAKLFRRFMQVPEEDYFGYTLPALIMFSFILTFPLNRRNYMDSGEFLFQHIKKIKEYLKKNPNLGATIMIVGTAQLLFGGIFPQEFRFFFDIFFFASFAGLLMVFLGENKTYKTFLIPGFVLLLLVKALESSLFTVIAYMSIAMASFFLIGNRTGFFKKIGFFIAGCFFLLVLQNSKVAYRKGIRKSGDSSSQLSTFFNIVQDQFFISENFFQVNEFYPIFIRLNQGFNVSQVMKRIPSAQDFDGGAMIKQSVLASITPRFLWPDKPKAGGHFNMKYYAGLTIIFGAYSTNVGPLGEAYGAFGVFGGILAMCALAFYIRFAYYGVWHISLKYPIMILWLPVIFYQTTYSAENDILQILNSTIKSSAFLWLVSKVQPRWFGINKMKN